jgi:predicted transcriptional regulator with HTH domain
MYFASVGGDYELIRLPAQCKRIVRWLTTAPVRKAFRNELDRLRPLRTSAGVAVEIHRRVRSYPSLHHATLWDQTKRVWGELSLEELVYPLPSLDAVSIASLGMVDEQLIQLCKRDDAYLVSGDEPLRGRAQHAEVMFMSPEELIR